MDELFVRDVKTIGKQINNALKEELDKDEVVVANFATTTKHGTMEGKTQIKDVEFTSPEKLIDLAITTKNEVDRLMRSFKNFNAIRNGIPVAIFGATNAGKSSLLNQLVEDAPAIVSNTHGTTRDTVNEL